jgi:uncharacterized YigZ family protein
LLFEDTYLTLQNAADGIFRDRGSKFIGFAYPIKSEEEVKQIIQQLKKEHPQANHHCYAYRLTPDPTVYRANDDREPSGSAGRPILNAILSAGLTDILVVVVRYFGGTLLGVPGLINAYREAAAEALKNGKTIEKTINENYCIGCEYPLLNEVYQFLRLAQATITGQETNEKCVIHFEIRKSLALDLESKFQLNHILQTSATLEHK